MSAEDKMDFLFLRVDSERSRRIELMIRRVLSQCRDWGLQCPSKINVFNLALWRGAVDKYVGCALEGFATGDEVSFSEVVREDEILHELLHNTYPQKVEDEVRVLTQTYARRLRERVATRPGRNLQARTENPEE